MLIVKQYLEYEKCQTYSIHVSLALFNVSQQACELNSLSSNSQTM